MERGRERATMGKSVVVHSSGRVISGRGSVKVFIFSIFLFSVSLSLFSQEAETLSHWTDAAASSNGEIEYDLNASWRVIFPVSKYAFFSFVDVSMGAGYAIISEYWYFGGAVDAAIGTDLAALFSKDEDEEEPDPGREYNQVAFSLGTRIYSKIKIFDFGLTSFAGIDMLFVTFPMLYAGMEISYKMFGLEYAYYFFTPKDNMIQHTRHQISLKFRLPH